MSVFSKKPQGFTIVELLIVIVVIAILAAIGVVAYSGIQDRANDTAVQGDLRNLAMKVREYHAINDVYPSSATTAVFPGNITLAINKRAYATDVSNLYYCVIPSGATARFSIAAKSKSGKVFAYYNGGFQTYSGAFSASTNICPNTGIPTTESGFVYHYGYYNITDIWNAWTKG